MFQKDIVFYLGQEKENGFSGVISEDGFLIIVESEEGLTVEEGRKKLNQLKDDILLSSVANLSDLEILINEKIKEHNFPANVSLAVGYVKGTVLYLKTIGSGKIYLRRKNQFGEIISEEQTASGHIYAADLYLFTTDHFIRTFGGEDEIKKIFDHKKPHEIMDEITPKLKGGDDQGVVALFAQFNEMETVLEPLFVSSPKPWEKVLFGLQSLYAKAQGYSQQAGEKKKYTLIVIIIIFCILVWSVGFGYTRRSEANIDKKILASKQIVSQKLDQADESAYLDLPQALVLIGEAKEEFDKLKNEVGSTKKGIAEIENLIKDRENKITKKEEKQYQEFFDLAVDNKQAKGSKTYLSVDNLSILDTGQGAIYTLSLTKKSLDKNAFPEIKTAKAIVRYENETFFLNANGFYKIEVDGKLKNIIEKDVDWGSIVDVSIYNGNIYAFDTEKDEIYKYLVAENGYSGKTSYFKGGTAGLRDGNSLAIDSSVYVGFPDHVFKFTAGVQDEFKTSFPESNVHLSKVFTTKDLEKVYVWDKEKGSIYVLGKNGTYEREIYSSILKKTDDFIIFENNAYLLSGSKIYAMNVD